ncbi:MAG: hypothetical protein AABX10_05070 [Nanoarchaeota archaeon]
MNLYKNFFTAGVLTTSTFLSGCSQRVYDSLEGVVKEEFGDAIRTDLIPNRNSHLLSYGLIIDTEKGKSVVTITQPILSTKSILALSTAINVGDTVRVTYNTISNDLIGRAFVDSIELVKK